MIDRKLLRDDPEKVRRAVAVRGMDLDVDRLVTLDRECRDLRHQLEQRRARRNQVQKELTAAIVAAKKAGVELPDNLRTKKRAPSPPP